MRKILNYLFEHRTLSSQEAEEVMLNIASGLYSESEIAAFLTVYLMRSITVEELSGFRNAMLNLCVKTDLSEFGTIDVCGTGGDNKETFNISTLTAFVLAGAGIRVAKHGNYGVTSACGSSNILEYFGYKFSTDPNKLKRELESAGICFLHAPLFNMAMKSVAPVRKALKVKTFFNMLGPLVNPSFPKRQLIGVYSLELARLYNYLFQETDMSYTIVYSLDGYDEVSLTSPFKCIINGVEQILFPEDLDYPAVQPSDLAAGKTVVESAAIFKSVLEGNSTPQKNNVVLANSQLAIKCCFPEKTLTECRNIVEDSLYNKKALDSFNKLIEIQQ
ncbi:MAG: anthranilate phosphoribosyltransferase [Bacteroidales bacterium]|nr:anthranilate phosphoribosyltransferase [Bacteroidales bacterium]